MKGERHLRQMQSVLWLHGLRSLARGRGSHHGLELERGLTLARLPRITRSYSSQTLSTR
jgi:hypothetical protein